MSLAYRKYFSGDDCTVQMVNSFDLNMETARRSMTVTRVLAEDTIALENTIFDFAVEQMKMKPNAVHIWECKDLGDPHGK